MKRRQSLLFSRMLVLLCRAAYGHHIELGYGTLKAACRFARQVEKCALSVFCVSGNVDIHVDQRVKITAVIIPNNTVEDTERNETLVSCVTQTGSKLGLDNLVQEGVTQESEFQTTLNACLEERGAPFRADIVFLRREREPCPGN